MNCPSRYQKHLILFSSRFVTVHIQRMGEGTVFSLSVHTSMGQGCPHPFQWGYPHPTYLMRGTPIPALDKGNIPIPGQKREDNLYPWWAWGRGTPIPGQDSCSPSQVGQVPGQDSGRGSPNWNSIACTCYTAGGMPLAFM